MAHSLPTSPNNIRVSTDILDTHPILEECEVTSKVDGKISHCSIKALGMDDIDAGLNVQDETVRNIQDSSIFYYPDSREVFEASLGNEGLIIGSLVNNRLIAFRSIWFPGLRPENLGRDIGMQALKQLSQVAHLERACVLPEFTGNRLQMRMTKHAIKLAK